MHSILREEGIALPSDSRTLMKNTSPKTYKIIPVAQGHYGHWGLETAIVNLLDNSDQELTGEKLYINVNFDGLSLFHSSHGQFWPILI